MARKPDVDQGLVKQGRCGRWRHGKTKRCRVRVKAKGRPCRIHNKNAPKGTDHWNYQGKGYSKYDTPETIRAWYERFLEDPDISLRGDIALTRALIQNTLSDLDAGVAKGWRKAIGDVRDRLQRAVDSGDTDAFQLAFADLDSLVKQGAQIDHATAELRAHQKTLREQIDTEVRRLRFDGAPAEEVIAFAYQMMNLFRVALQRVADGESVGSAEAEMVERFRALVGGDQGDVN